MNVHEKIELPLLVVVIIANEKLKLKLTVEYIIKLLLL